MNDQKRTLHPLVPDHIYQPLCGKWGCRWSMGTGKNDEPAFFHDQNGIVLVIDIPWALLNDANADIWGVLVKPWLRSLHP